MSSTRRVISALAAGLAVTWSLGAAPAAAAPAEGGLAGFHAQHLRWHACQLGPQDEEGQALDEAGAQCTEVIVPLDYARPAGRTITLALSLLRATDTAGRIGALVINLGGPAIPGLDTVPLAREAMGDTGARFDLIGLDRRFVGRSTPLDCALPASWIPRSAGTDRRSFDRMVGLAASVASRCDRAHGDVLAHASTADSARDLDVVRAALGEPTLSYLGYSYGSYLGAVYTQLFPHRAGRIVLDSAVDPARPGALTAGRETGPVREAALREWAGWAAARVDRYHLGASADAVLATVTRIYQASARRPLRVGQFRVDDTVMPALLLDPLSDDSEDSNAELAATLQVLAQAATGGAATGGTGVFGAATASSAATPTPELNAALTGLLTGARSPAQSAQATILCSDSVVPRDPRWYWRDIEAHRAEAPLFGPLNRDISPCAFWPVRPERPVRVHNGVPALVVNADGDINATYPGALAMRQALTGSRLITLAGVRTHGVYLFRGDPCVDGAVSAYLRTGVTPARDLVCT